jgi:hypothetical protein
MLFGNRRQRTSGARRRPVATIDLLGEKLEDRLLLAIDLGGTLPSINPLIASTPFGMDFGLKTPTPPTASTLNKGAGWSTADLGDVNGDNYDDFLIGSPTVGSTPAVLGNGLNSAVYLVFGSNTMTGTGTSAVNDWLTTTTTPPAQAYQANDRVGDTGQLGAAAQTNPVTNTPLRLPFAGIKFVTLLNTQSMLGASVASVKMPNGQTGFLMGAPGGLNGIGTEPGTGRVYLVWGSSATALNNFLGQTINLDDPNFATDFPGLNLITFVNPLLSTGKLGYSVAGGTNLLGDGASDIILGAPTATVVTSTSTGGITSGTGVVYVISTAILPSNTATFDVTTVGQTGSQSVLLAGAASGDQAGFSVADGGNVNGSTGSVDDLLIGAPTASSGAGSAYLVYGGSNLAGRSTITGNARFIILSNVGATGTNAVPGAAISGPAGGSLTGFSVSSAGDFNNDGFGDFMIGSPGFSSSTSLTSQGEVTMFYGASSTSSALPSGQFSLTNIPAAISSVAFTGANAGDLAGYSLTPVGFINSGQPNPIMMGAPGFNSSSGTAYLIPGRTGLTGTFSLASAETAPLSGVQFLLTTPASPSSSPNFFGASVSSRFQDTSFTADSDSRADFIVGSPGYDITQDATHVLAGGAQIVQTGYVTVPIPSAAAITTQIGVGTPFAPFTINATTPSNLQIFVFGTLSTTPAFMPVTDINPATVKVNGVAFPNATIQQDPNTNNYLNGIPDAIITISPRSSLNLMSGLTTITITGQTLASSPLPNQTWTGSAAVTVTGGTVSPIIGALAGVAPGPVTEQFLTTQFGNNQFTPSVSQFSAYSYQPIPLPVALEQYLPPEGFRQRIYAFNHPGKKIGWGLQNRGQARGRVGGFNQLSSRVFDRGRFHPQRNYTWHHRGLKLGVFRGVVPIQLTTQHYNDNQLKGG